MSWVVERLTIIGALIAAIGAIMAAVGAYRDQRELAAKSDENARLSRDLAAQSDEIARLAKEGLAAVVGGDSFVYLEPLRRRGKVRFFLRQTGQHPTYDVVIRIEEVSRPNGAEKRRLIFGPAEGGRTLLRGSGFDWTYPDPAFADRREWPLVFVEPPTRFQASREFRVEIAARNGIVVQRLRVWPVANRWHTESTDVERPGVGRPTLPNDFNEAQAQDADGNRLPKTTGEAK